MRYVVVLLVGVMIGALATATALNILRQGSEFPKGVMAVMQYHMGQVREQVSAGRCAEAAPHFQTLRALAADIEPAFLPTGLDDALFTRYSEQLRGRLDKVLDAPASECRVLTEQLGQVGDGCKACHRDFKSG